VGQLNLKGFPDRPELKANSVTESAKIQGQRSNSMKVKTNTKAGNALWGS
jgi:hypothetical protein